MTSRSALRKNAMQIDTFETNSQMSKPKDIKQCLKLLETGELSLDNVDIVQAELLLKPYLGDHIQYELQKYCQKNEINTNLELVVKLAEVCYSEASVVQFSNMDRFVGCVYYITHYLLKREKYKSALDIIYKLKLKKVEILKASKDRVDMRNFLWNLHSSFMSAAIALAPKVQNMDEYNTVCHQLALASVDVFLLTCTKDIEIGKKVLRTSKYYLQTIKHYKGEDILQFYETLHKVFKILLPKMHTSDYFLYFMHKMQLQNSDQQEIYRMLKKTIELFSLFLNLSPLIKDSLSYVLDYFFSYNLGKIALKSEHFKILIACEYSEMCFILVSIIFHHAIQFLWKICEDEWSDISSAVVEQWSDNITEFYKNHCQNISLYCTPKRIPFETCFGDLLTGNFRSIQYTIRFCLKSKISNALKLVKASREAYSLTIECLEYMKIRGCCMEQRSFSWTSTDQPILSLSINFVQLHLLTVIHHTNTVEDIYKYTPSDEAQSLINDCASEILKEIVNSEMKVPFDFRRISILFQRWHTANIKLRKFHDALLVSACYLASYPEQETEIMGMWLQVKAESADKIIQGVTMIDMLTEHCATVQEFKKTFSLSELDLKKVLTMELKLYTTCAADIFQKPNTPYTLALRIFKQLEKCNLDIWKMSFALSCLISANYLGEDNELPKNFMEKFKKLRNELLNWKLKNRAQSRSLLHAANLNFALFLYNVKLIEKSEGQMDSSQMVMGYLLKAQEEKVKFGEDVDLNLTCNVIPSSSHLTVESETNYLKELNEVVDLWNSALKNGFEELPTSLEFDLWLQNVYQVALWYELIGEYQKSFTSWLMYFKIGKLCSNSCATLLGLSHLIQDCCNVEESGLLEEAELLTGRLGTDQKDKEVLVEYCLAVAGNYLKNKKFEKCIEYLTTAKKLLGGLTVTIKTYGLRARFWCLVSQFLSTNKESAAVFDYPLGTDLRVMVFKAFSFANIGGRSELINTATRSDCIELVLTMVEVNTWAFYLHGVYRQTDFMKFFLDDLYQIVQKLFLPTRTAEILIRLAEVDVICDKMSDCQEKVNKLKNILTTLSRSEGIKYEKTPPRLPKAQMEFEIPSPRPISPARFLDKPYGERKRFDTSPINYDLTDVKVRKSEHERKCKCRLCQNLLIQILTMNIMWLEAEINNFENQTKEAAKCYNRAYDVLNKIEQVRAEQSKLLRFELATIIKQIPGELDFHLAPVQFHCARFLIRYALFESSSLKAVTDNVTKAMLKVSRFMKKFSHEEKLLQWAFMELKLFCVEMQKKPTKKSTPVVREGALEIAKTPAISNSTNIFAPKNKARILQKTPNCIQGVQKISELQTPNDELNTAFVTIKKAPPERIYSFKPRKLNVEESEDILEKPKERNCLAVKKTKKAATAAPNKRGK